MAHAARNARSRLPICIPTRVTKIVIAAVACGILVIVFHQWSYNFQEVPLEVKKDDTRKVITTVNVESSNRYPVLDDGRRRDEITVVTSYISIGSFMKGAGGSTFTPQLYQSWMEVFSRIRNPVIAFFDNVQHAATFSLIRQGLPTNLTEIIVIDRAKLWSFALLPKIRHLFSQPGYPYHPPNTVVPEYSCAMHAKYEFMLSAVERNHFRTKYFAWLDIGLFRDLVTNRNDLTSIYLGLPPGFNASTVAYTEVYDRSISLSARTIVATNNVWVCGCFFLATAPVMKTWASEYKRGVEAMLARDIMSTDQQVIYDMVNNGHPAVDIQTYRSDGSTNIWFHLGYLCRESGRNRTLST